MDALQHADELLADAHRRHPTRVVPASAASPMDDRQTLVIPQTLIDECEPVEGSRLVGILDDAALAVLDRDAALAKAQQNIVDPEMEQLALRQPRSGFRRAV